MAGATEALRKPPETRARERARTGRSGRGQGASGPLAVITGGSGFVGTNLADRLLADGRRVRVVDNLGRAGSELNLRWLRETHGDRLDVRLVDVRDADGVRDAVQDASSVFHLAAQVAVTTSLARPLEDFEVNLQGTIHVLEALRALPEPPRLLFTSTNKVYGSLPALELERDGKRWEPVDARLRGHGLSEDAPLDFRTPYGCSKGAADQYVLDYAYSFGVPAVVFRMSCIYGPHQHGNEDQGWVAHFLLRALAGEGVTVYGDGAQVRDVLHVDDLVDALLLAESSAGELAGTAFNIGGGPANAVSVLDVLDLIGDARGEPPAVAFAPERPGDQRWYVSDTSRFRGATGWEPRVPVGEGVRSLYRRLAARRPGRVEGTAR